ncbi:glycosyltransferase family 1 protein [Backusella circina FSU 941]|nr:glycosyltransferase family 1 protein [Backusella circina FSU 941]
MTIHPKAAVVVCSHSVAAASPDDLATIFQTFREPKKMGFAGAIGGSSHFNWVLSIMDELADRGHNITFFAKDDFTRFGKPYPNINTVSLGAPYIYDRAAILDDPGKRGNMLKMMPTMIRMLSANMEQDYTTMTDFIKLYELDVILCDHFFEPCVNAANAAKIPFIITTALEMTKDSAAPYVNNDMMSMGEPTTEGQSIWKRFNNKFVLPVRMIKSMWPLFQELKEKKQALGITSSGDPSVDWKDSMKLVNSVFGLTPARPMGPLVEAVGPIIPSLLPQMVGVTVSGEGVGVVVGSTMAPSSPRHVL